MKFDFINFTLMWKIWIREKVRKKENQEFEIFDDSFDKIKNDFFTYFLTVITFYQKKGWLFLVIYKKGKEKLNGKNYINN